MFSEPSEDLVYGAAGIKVLKGLEAIRRRPAMYIGDTADGTGLRNMLYEVVDSAIEEALDAYATELAVTLNADGSATVRDNGRPLPAEIHPGEGVSAAEMILTRLHAGGMLECDRRWYRTTADNRLGLAVVNVLSARLDLRFWQAGKEHRVRFRDGVAEAPLAVVGPAGDRRGVEITFWPSPAVFHPVTDFDCAGLEQRLRHLAASQSGVRVVLRDDRPGHKRLERMNGGPAGLVRYLDRSRRPLLDAPIVIDGHIAAVISFEAALWWHEGPQVQVLCFANALQRRDGSFEQTACEAAITGAVERHARTGVDRRSERVPIVGDDVRPGLTAVVALQIPDWDPCLQSPVVAAVVESVVGDRLGAWLRAHPREAQVVLARARKAASGRAVSTFAQRLPAGRC